MKTSLAPSFPNHRRALRRAGASGPASPAGVPQPHSLVPASANNRFGVEKRQGLGTPSRVTGITPECGSRTPDELHAWGLTRHREVWALFPCLRICYNHRAVEPALKQASDRVRESDLASGAEAAAVSPAAFAADPKAAGNFVDVSRYCPVCSQRLEARSCKLICAVCGYYMSCADYY
jgi:hypothetical protein